MVILNHNSIPFIRNIGKVEKMGKDQINYKTNSKMVVNGNIYSSVSQTHIFFL